jgi:hypothetical protein
MTYQAYKQPPRHQLSSFGQLLLISLLLLLLLLQQQSPLQPLSCCVAWTVTNSCNIRNNHRKRDNNWNVIYPIGATRHLSHHCNHHHHHRRRRHRASLQLIPLYDVTVGTTGNTVEMTNTSAVSTVENDDSLSVDNTSDVGHDTNSIVRDMSNDADEYEYVEFDNLTEQEFIGSEWLIGTNWDQNTNKIDETWARLIVDTDGKNVVVWGDQSKGTWTLDVAAQFLSLSKENVLAGKEIWACTVSDYYFLQGTVRGWKYWSAAAVIGQWQAKRLGVDREEAGTAPWLEMDGTIPSP